MTQLLLFEEPQEIKLERKMLHLEEKYDKLRKGQYAKITKLQSEVKDLIQQLEFIKSKISKEGLFI